jgi:hypothetical protein
MSCSGAAGVVAAAVLAGSGEGVMLLTASAKSDE